MGRSVNRLSAIAAKSKKERGTHSDGGGLYLQISKYGTKSWVFRFQLDKK